MSVFIERIKIKNLLSFDEEGIDFELKPLNVLIGANASGKSNFVHALELLCSTATGLSTQVSEFGGIEEIMHKNVEIDRTSLGVILAQDESHIGAEYVLELGVNYGYMNILSESLHLCNTKILGSKEQDKFALYSRGHSKALLHSLKKRDELSPNAPPEFEIQELGPEQFDFSKSVFEQRKDPVLYPDITTVGEIFSRSSFGGFFTAVDVDKSRRFNKPDDFGWYLWRDGSNLPMILSKLDNAGILHSEILPRLKDFYPSIKDIRTVVQGGRVEIRVWEDSLRKPISLGRVSSGTIAFLRILAAVFNPEPYLRGRLLCFEEPETGFHPEALPVLAQCIKDSPVPTQIVITTHSPLFIESFQPEDIIVVEKYADATRLERKSRTELKRWLKRYTLGELWLKGVIGGTRY